MTTTTRQHDEPRSMPAMWTAFPRLWRAIKTPARAQEPCRCHPREWFPWTVDCRRARGVLPHHPPLPGVAGVARPTTYIERLQTLPISTRAESCTGFFHLHFHRRRRNGMLSIRTECTRNSRSIAVDQKGTSSTIRVKEDKASEEDNRKSES